MSGGAAHQRPSLPSSESGSCYRAPHSMIAPDYVRATIHGLKVESVQEIIDSTAEES